MLQIFASKIITEKMAIKQGQTILTLATILEGLCKTLLFPFSFKHQVHKCERKPATLYCNVLVHEEHMSVYAAALLYILMHLTPKTTSDFMYIIRMINIDQASDLPC